MASLATGLFTYSQGFLHILDMFLHTRRDISNLLKLALQSVFTKTTFALVDFALWHAWAYFKLL